MIRLRHLQMLPRTIIITLGSTYHRQSFLMEVIFATTSYLQNASFTDHYYLKLKYALYLLKGCKETAGWWLSPIGREAGLKACWEQEQRSEKGGRKGKGLRQRRLPNCEIVNDEVGGDDDDETWATRNIVSKFHDTPLNLSRQRNKNYTHDVVS